MISGLHHVAIAARDVDAVADGYRRLLGVAPERDDGRGARGAWFHFPNMSLEIIARDGEDGPDGVWLLAFAAPDLAAAARLAERRGLPVTTRTERAVMLDPAATAGIQLVLMDAARPPAAPAGPVAGLDHVVIRTPNIDRAVANYGGRLGLDLRLDRANAAWGARQLFFRCGEAVVEFAASLKEPVSDGPDSFGGLAWRVPDPEAAQAQMAAAGFDVSEVRAGRKPGTKVFTVRDAPAGVPTLMLSAEPAKEPA